MRVGGLLCALVAGSCLIAMGVVPSAVGDTGCGEGYEVGAGHEYDDDGDGLVCVNRETGEVTDDQGGQSGIVDRNGDGFTCVKETPNGSLVITDNNANNPENSNCPPGFVASSLG